MPCWCPDGFAQCLLGNLSSPWGVETRWDHHAPKKGDLSKCDNWRGITLLSVPGKVFSIVPLNSPRQAVDACLRDQQAASRRGRSCTEDLWIFFLRHVIGQSLEYQQRISLNFIDFVKAFDSVHRDTQWKIARAYGLPSRFVDIFRNLYQGSPCCVRMEERITDFFGWNYRMTRVCAFTNVISPCHRLCRLPLHRPHTHWHSLDSL